MVNESPAARSLHSGEPGPLEDPVGKGRPSSRSVYRLQLLRQLPRLHLGSVTHDGDRRHRWSTEICRVEQIKNLYFRSAGDNIVSCRGQCAVYSVHCPNAYTSDARADESKRTKSTNVM